MVYSLLRSWPLQHYIWINVIFSHILFWKSDFTHSLKTWNSAGGSGDNKGFMCNTGPSTDANLANASSSVTLSLVNTLTHIHELAHSCNKPKIVGEWHRKLDKWEDQGWCEQVRTWISFSYLHAPCSGGFCSAVCACCCWDARCSGASSSPGGCVVTSVSIKLGFECGFSHSKMSLCCSKFLYFPYTSFKLTPFLFQKSLHNSLVNSCSWWSSPSLTSTVLWKHPSREFYASHPHTLLTLSLLLLSSYLATFFFFFAKDRCYRHLHRCRWSVRSLKIGRQH